MIVKANIGDRIAFEILYDFHLLKNSYQILYDSLPDVKKRAEIEMNDTLKKLIRKIMKWNHLFIILITTRYMKKNYQTEFPILL
ncbi:MAG: hypothetical protein JXD23_10505 [Spirochaetales bacterium]|nr:hypothetical protein [Spirochaetales bacterium]